MPSLYLIRHAQSMANANSHLICGRSNESPITPLGERQAHALGAYLKDESITFDEVYTSPALRTRETARIVCGHIGFPIERIVESDMVQELSQGDWVGRDRRTIYTPELKQIINLNNHDFKAPGGESQREVEERMTAWAKYAVIDQHANDNANIALFGHGLAIKCFLRGVFGWHPSNTYVIDFPNTSISHIVYGTKEWYLQFLNRTGHLLDVK
ncbi:TPA: histidine phosphatase family protein [Candidatus Woesearchaeota archaeon]|nr:histidine phosphatase family protein [Candidatus Woesearchaeota archaeon]